MPDLPGYYFPHCRNCYSSTHSTTQCPYEDEGDLMPRDDYTGLQRDLYDDLCAILRNYDYNDQDAQRLMEVLEDDLSRN